MSWDPELYEARHSFVWEMGRGVLDLLQAKSGEKILDAGCGTGHLTQEIAASGATVLGVDSSPEMIGQARQNFPGLSFSLADITQLSFDAEFDAIFSNATLHWVKDAQGAARAMACSLKKGGRLVAEFGGRGNIMQIETALRMVLARHQPVVPPSPLYFPSIGEYTSLLEEHGLEARFAHLFERLTPLEGAQGMENWIVQFKSFYLSPLSREVRALVLRETLDALRPLLFREGTWFADYRRLRVVAVKS